MASGSYVKLEGPGMIMIETGLQDESLIARSFSKRDATR